MVLKFVIGSGLLAAAGAVCAATCAPIAVGTAFSNNTTVTNATVVAATPTVPEHCRLVARIRNAEDGLSNIQVEYRLPDAAQWNRKLLGLGNGGLAGSFQSTAQATAAVAKGYATAQTDTGHAASANATWALTAPGDVNEVTVTDFGNRSIHLMTVVAKEVIQSYYGSAPRLAYFQGCSTGGREASREVQQYPADYDGVIAGAPLIAHTRKQLMAAWEMQQFYNDPAATLRREHPALIQDAVMKACDALDGVVDGVLDDPRRCKWDPQELLCSGEPSASCLTQPQIDAVRRIYEGPINDAGEQLYPAHPRGLESAWTNWLGFGSSGTGSNAASALQTFRYMVFLDPAYDIFSFDINNPADVAAIDNSLMAIAGHATNPDIRPFVDHGGKLIIYHGFDDNGFTPYVTIDYYEQAEKILAAHLRPAGNPHAAVREHVRLFLLPGVDHCGGGTAGPDTADWLTPLERWVEEGVAPERIVATKAATGRTRPLCPYPLVARYTGSGSTEEAQNFVCVTGIGEGAGHGEGKRE